MEQILIEKLDHEGRGITYVDEKITFIENALPEETVDIKIKQEKRKINIAEVTKFHKKSPKRIKPICPYFKKCGGCDLLHLSYEDTIEFKYKKLEEILKKYAKLTPKIEIIKNINPLYYRNKITLKIIDGQFGFYKRETHKLITVEKCFITKKSINDFLTDINLLNIKNGEITIRSNYNDELLISIDTGEKIVPDIDSIRKKHKLVGIIVNNKKIYGKSFFIEKAGEYFFQVSYNSFFQVNEYMNNQVLEIISEEDFSNQRVLDLYCGVGQLGFATSKSVKEVYGIELVSNAVADALVSAKMNKLKNYYFFNGNASEVLKKIPTEFDCIIIDPPRGGLNKDTLHHIELINPQNIIYMSCDAMTLARDLNKLKEKYTIKKLFLLDMFSYTHHLEALVLLER